MKTLRRQGDVILKKAEIPQGATKRNSLVLAEGEVTGHFHRLENGQTFEFDGKLYAEITEKYSTLYHEEHEIQEVPAGTYEIIIQREYDDEKEWRNVCD